MLLSAVLLTVKMCLLDGYAKVGAKHSMVLNNCDLAMTDVLLPSLRLL